MARQQRCVGLVAAACVLAAAAAAASGNEVARKTPRDAGGVTFSTSMSGGEAILVAEGAGVRFEQRAGQRGMHFQVSARGDVVSVRVDTDVAVVARRGREITIPRHGAGGAARMQEVAALLRDSPAIGALAMMAQQSASAGDSGRSLEFAAAVMRALQGDPLPAQAIARRLAGARSDRHLVRAMAGAGTIHCYDEWQTDVVRYMEEYLACDEAMRWYPLGGLACTQEWLFKVTIANVALMMCLA